MGVGVAVGMEVGGEDGVAVSKAVGVEVGEEVGVAVGVAVDVICCLLLFLRSGCLQCYRAFQLVFFAVGVAWEWVW